MSANEVSDREAFSKFLRGVLVDNQQRGRGGEAWLRRKLGASKSQMNNWLDATNVPAEKKFREVLPLLLSEGLIRPDQEAACRTAWAASVRAKWDAKTKADAARTAALLEADPVTVAFRRALSSVAEAGDPEDLRLMLEAIARRPAITGGLLEVAGAAERALKRPSEQEGA